MTSIDEEDVFLEKHPTNPEYLPIEVICTHCHQPLAAKLTGYTTWGFQTFDYIHANGRKECDLTLTAKPWCGFQADRAYNEAHEKWMREYDERIEEDGEDGAATVERDEGGWDHPSRARARRRGGRAVSIG